MQVKTKGKSSELKRRTFRPWPIYEPHLPHATNEQFLQLCDNVQALDPLEKRAVCMGTKPNKVVMLALTTQLNSPPEYPGVIHP